MEDAFTKIYNNKVWGVDKTTGFGTSGPGSAFEYSKPYVDFISDFIKKNGIKSVIDIGCGDWQFSKHLYNEEHTKNVHYYGYDCCEYVIKQNIEHYSSDNRHFKHISGDDILNDIESQADLVLIKDVIQHWPNDTIIEFLDKLSERKNGYKFVILTNCKSSSTSRMDIKIGGFKQINWASPMFRNYKIQRILSYHSKEIVMFHGTMDS